MKRYIVVLLLIALLFPLAGNASQQRLRTIVNLEDFAYDYNFAIKTFKGAKRDLLFYPNLHTVENSGPMDLMVIQIEDGKAQIFLQFPAGKKDIITVAFVTLLENLSLEDFGAKDYISAILHACELQTEVIDAELSALEGVGALRSDLKLGDTGECKMGLTSALWVIAEYKDKPIYSLNISKIR